ncbi:hypothetical protein Y027_5648 [Burkholderia pseudomallei TSV5]|nr:hypothetical protein Y027_5648 [Burkholderia pseudomallei TSV5]KGX50383.1 hypothetical protein Y025_5419 [Burkholderia pseudomallei TSV32]
MASASAWPCRAPDVRVSMRSKGRRTRSPNRWTCASAPDRLPPQSIERHDTSAHRHARPCVRSTRIFRVHPAQQQLRERRTLLQLRRMPRVLEARMPDRMRHLPRDRPLVAMPVRAVRRAPREQRRLRHLHRARRAAVKALPQRREATERAVVERRIEHRREFPVAAFRHRLPEPARADLARGERARALPDERRRKEVARVHMPRPCHLFVPCGALPEQQPPDERGLRGRDLQRDMRPYAREREQVRPFVQVREHRLDRGAVVVERKREMPVRHGEAEARRLEADDARVRRDERDQRVEVLDDARRIADEHDRRPSARARAGHARADRRGGHVAKAYVGPRARGPAARDPRRARAEPQRIEPRHVEAVAPPARGRMRRILQMLRAHRDLLRRPEDHLRAAERREQLVRLAMPDGRVPDLRRAAAVDRARVADDRAVACGAHEIALQLERAETGRALRQAREASVAARGIGEAHDRARMQNAVREHGLADRQLGEHVVFLDLLDDDAEQARQIVGAEPVEVVRVQFLLHAVFLVRCSGCRSARRTARATG